MKKHKEAIKDMQNNKQTDFLFTVSQGGPSYSTSVAKLITGVFKTTGGVPFKLHLVGA